MRGTASARRTGDAFRRVHGRNIVYFYTYIHTPTSSSSNNNTWEMTTITTFTKIVRTMNEFVHIFTLDLICRELTIASRRQKETTTKKCDAMIRNEHFFFLATMVGGHTYMYSARVLVFGARSAVNIDKHRINNISFILSSWPWFIQFSCCFLYYIQRFCVIFDVE